MENKQLVLFFAADVLLTFFVIWFFLNRKKKNQDLWQNQSSADSRPANGPAPILEESLDPVLLAELKDRVARNDLMGAIKTLVSTTGCGLLQAREFVESLKRR